LIDKEKIYYSKKLENSEINKKQQEIQEKKLELSILRFYHIYYLVL